MLNMFGLDSTSEASCSWCLPILVWWAWGQGAKEDVARNKKNPKYTVVRVCIRLFRFRLIRFFGKYGCCIRFSFGDNQSILAWFQ